MKKFLIFLVISLSIFLIYFFNRDTKIYYVALGDINNTYYKEVAKTLKDTNKLEDTRFQFLEKNYNAKDIYNQVLKNVSKNNQTIKNALIKADVVTIYLDTNNILNHEGDFSYVDKKSVDLEKMIKILKENCKEKIILIGPDDSYSGSLKYLNKVFRNVASRNKITYIKIQPTVNITEEILDKINSTT